MTCTDSIIFRLRNGKANRIFSSAAINVSIISRKALYQAMLMLNYTVTEIVRPVGDKTRKIITSFGRLD